MFLNSLVENILWVVNEIFSYITKFITYKFHLVVKEYNLVEVVDYNKKNYHLN